MAGKDSSSRKSPVRHDERTITEGLIALALESGNSRRAVKRMTKKVHHSTLQRWQETYAEKYEELKRELIPKVREQAAELQMDVAEEARRVELKLLSRLDSEAGELPIRDVSTAARNSAVEQGIHLQRAQELRGDLPAPVVQINLTGMIRSMGERGQKFFDADGKPLSTEEAVRRAQGKAIEGTATEESTPDDAGAQ